MAPIVAIEGVPFQKQVNAMLRAKFGATCTYKDLEAFREETGYMPFYIRKDATYRASRGTYNIPDDDAPLSKHGPQSDAVPVLNDVDDELVQVDSAVAVIEDDDEVEPSIHPERPAFRAEDLKSLTLTDIEQRIEALVAEASLMSIVPDINPAFVPFGDYEMEKEVIASKIFFPMFKSGLSGNGKTMFPEQACAELNREFINIDITCETDEDDLIGGFRLRNGETYFELGPVLVAMLRGALLVCNELDLGSSKIMCMQRVLEGKPVVVKKLGIVIKPKEGFNVIATANTKGRGDDRGRFIGTGLLNEAFLERFPITIEQEYPPIDIETKILAQTYQALGGQLKATPATFFNTLAKWADAIRKSYEAGGCEDLISTRRLCHIVKAYFIFKDQNKALTYCIQRFDSKVRDSFVDFYNKICPAKADQPTNVGSL
jgi:hypothetical protein